MRFLLAIVGLFLAALLSFWGALQLGQDPLPGVLIEGAPLSGLASTCRALEQRSLTIESGNFETVVPRSRLGLRCDYDAIGANLRAVGRRGHPIRDLLEFWESQQGQIDHAASIRFDSASFSEVAREVTEALNRPAVPSELVLEENRFRRGQFGTRVTLSEVTSQLQRAIRSGQQRVKIAVRSVEPGGLDLGKHFSFAEVLASFETQFHRYGNLVGRAHNVRLAARRLDGTIIHPGQVFSFNERIGPRRHRDGFRNAPVIIHGEIVDGAGGGVCQVASTLHAAAFYAGLTNVEYEPHSRPSSYIPMGLDATVVWPYTDLRIRNPFDFPIVVRSTISENVHRVELRGQTIPRDVEMDREFLATRTFTNRVQSDPTLAPGQRVITQNGIRGFTVRRVRTVRDGPETFVDEEVLVYPPTDRIVRVGSGG